MPVEDEGPSLRQPRRWPLVAGGAAAGAIVVATAGLLLGVGRTPPRRADPGSATTLPAPGAPGGGSADTGAAVAGPVPAGVTGGALAPGAITVPVRPGGGTPTRRDGGTPDTQPGSGTVPPDDGSVPGEYPAQQDLAGRLVAVWHRGDRAGAAALATPDTVDRLFALPWTAEDRSLGCFGQPTGDVDCRWSYPEGVVHLVVDDRGDGLKAHAVVTTAT